MLLKALQRLVEVEGTGPFPTAKGTAGTVLGLNRTTAGFSASRNVRDNVRIIVSSMDMLDAVLVAEWSGCGIISKKANSFAYRTS